MLHPQGSDPAAPQSPGASPQGGFDAQRTDSGDGSTHGGDASGQQGASPQGVKPQECCATKSRPSARTCPASCCEYEHDKAQKPDKSTEMQLGGKAKVQAVAVASASGGCLRMAHEHLTLLQGVV